jgi:DNA polymerase III delta subunit
MKALVDAVSCFPFISQKRMVRVTEFYPTEKEYEAYLKPLFENPPLDSILLIVNGLKGKKDAESLAKKPNVTYVDCGRSDLEMIKRWIYLTCKKEGLYADGVTCGKLAEYCVMDMARIAKETEKLLGYCLSTGQTRLTDEIVDELVYPDSEYKIYELANAIARKNYSAFIKVAKDLSEQGYNENALLSALASYFKGLYETSLCRGSDRDVAAALGIKEYAAKKNREQAAKFGKDELFSLYETVYGAVNGMRGGLLSPDGALKLVTAKLFFKQD